MRVFVFGNQDFEYDNMAVRIMQGLEQEFVHCHNPFEALDSGDEHIIIIDVVQGLREIRQVAVDELENGNIFSLHDFDLSYLLQLYEKMGKLGRVTVIGVPQRGDESALRKELDLFLKQQII